MLEVWRFICCVRRIGLSVLNVMIEFRGYHMTDKCPLRYRYLYGLPSVLIGGASTPIPGLYRTDMSYYSPNEILISSLAAPSTFLLTVPGLGFLSSASTPDIQKGQTLPLPLYLASFLAHQSLGTHPAITHDFPAFLEARVMNALKADPKSVDLRALYAFFYEGAAACLEGLEDENEIVGVLEEV